MPVKLDQLYHLDWLSRLAFHLGSSRLVTIMRRMLGNISLFRKGLPDLTLIREIPVGTKNDMPSVLFVEVKGERDSLQPDQSDWIEFFVENSINFELCKVGMIRSNHR
mgnify:CR=1 FL=1